MTTEAVHEFEAQRRRLFGLAYRMLGSAEEAEDVVQDAYLRLHGVDHATIETPRAWLTKVVTNLCLNRLDSARARREQYVGPWLPEPVQTTGGALGPLDTAEQRESVSMALLLLLERLTPTERATFVLREAFGYSHREIAAILDHSEAGCRQLHRRARQRLADPARQADSDPQTHRRLTERFLTAARNGDLQGLEQLLAADVTSWSDGGGKVSAARHPVHGRTKVARLFSGIFRRAVGAEISTVEINGAPAVVGFLDGQLLGAFVPQFADERIVALHTVANPDKLGYLARQLSHSGERSGRNG